MPSEKPNILLISPVSPSATGSGDAVRSYHFVKALAQVAHLYLVILSPDPAQPPDPALSRSCRRILIAPSASPVEGSHASRRSRLLNYLSVATLLVTPWRGWWSELLRFANGFGVDVWKGKNDRTSSLKWTQRALAACIRWELSLAAAFGKPLPLWTFGHWEGYKALERDLKRLLQEVPFQVLWYEHSPLYPVAQQLLKEAPSLQVVCNAHNVESLANQRIQKLDREPRRTRLLRSQPRILERVEAEAFARSDLVFSCSEEDKALALKLAPHATIQVIGNGVDTSHFRPNDGAARANVPTILFTGSLGYAPNSDAVKFFVEEIYPKIKLRLPECRFVVAGRNADSVMSACGVREESVSVVSNPVDMRPLFEQAWVCVVPLRAGGGTRLKIPEAMAMERAVVSTRIGAEGVPYRDREHLLLADEPQEFAEAVCALLTDEPLRTRLERNAASFVRENYGWDSLTSTAMTKVLDLVRKRGA